MKQPRALKQRAPALCAMLAVALAAALFLGGIGESASSSPGRIQKVQSRDAAHTAGPVPVIVRQIRHISSKNYTRVVLDLSAEPRYEVRFLEGDLPKKLPPRLYVDLLGARVGLRASRPVPVQNQLLQQIRAGQFRPEVARVVLEMNSLADFRTFLLPGPPRLVIDIQGQGGGAAPAAPVAKGPPRSPAGPPALNSLRKIVLDPGHGGKDAGAIGPRGLTEKEVVLTLARKLARKLKKELGVEVILTRDDDTFVELKDRPEVAKAANADLFISLHTNASPSRHTRGIETYYLDNTNDEASKRLAARENGVSPGSVSDIQFILSDLIQNSKLEDSIGLAHELQSALVSKLGRRYSDVKDLGVKKALFHVLVGTRMPSVLVELFFISNRAEERRLSNPAYQDAIVEALFLGIKQYRNNGLLAKSL